MLYKTADIHKDRAYDFQEYRTRCYLELEILNGTTTLDNTTNDQVYLKDAIDNFKKSARPRLQEKINEKELTLKNVTDLLTGRLWIINAFESGIFPMTYI